MRESDNVIVIVFSNLRSDPCIDRYLGMTLCCKCQCHSLDTWHVLSGHLVGTGSLCVPLLGTATQAECRHFRTRGHRHQHLIPRRYQTRRRTSTAQKSTRSVSRHRRLPLAPARAEHTRHVSSRPFCGDPSQLPYFSEKSKKLGHLLEPNLSAQQPVPLSLEPPLRP